MRLRIAAAICIAFFGCAFAASAQTCHGDLNGDGQVTITELITEVSTALYGCPQSGACPGDLNADGQVTITELVQCVRSALDGCPPTACLFAFDVSTPQGKSCMFLGTFDEVRCPDVRIGASVASEFSAAFNAQIVVVTFTDPPAVFLAVPTGPDSAGIFAWSSSGPFGPFVTLSGSIYLENASRHLLLVTGTNRIDLSAQGCAFESYNADFDAIGPGPSSY